MKKQVVVLPLLLLLAALLGWLLPGAAFYLLDSSAEGRTETLALRQIDLNYSSELDTAARLQLAASLSERGEYIPMERGIFLQEQEAVAAAEHFLQIVTGSEQSLQDQLEAQPMLLRGQEGSFVVWTLSCHIEERWHCEMMIDDQSGVLLRCQISSMEAWDRLITDLDRMEDIGHDLSARFAEAIRAEYAGQLSIPLRAEQELIGDDSLHCSGEIVLYEGSEERYRLPFILAYDAAYIGINTIY